MSTLAGAGWRKRSCPRTGRAGPGERTPDAAGPDVRREAAPPRAAAAAPPAAAAPDSISRGAARAGGRRRGGGGERGRLAGAMRRRGAVQRKVPCLFVTEVKDEPSAKRERQVAGAAPGREDGGQAGGAGPCPSAGETAGPRLTTARTVPEPPAAAEWPEGRLQS